jgi:para-aminobenzoate synthetase/4-amino-4-deoxychorismate lyase
VDGPPLAWFGLCAEPTGVPVITPVGGAERPYQVDEWRPGWRLADYHDQVRRVRERIAAGDTYQCNLTVRMHAHATGELEQFYADLVTAQRGAHCAYLDLGRFAVLSASPELFFGWSGDRLTTRPMKGTAPRGRQVAEDDVLAERLRTSAKERAENVMIVDLMRNDLGRIARTGTVSVGSLCAVERYDTVMQMTSEVTARLPGEATLVDVFRALFPCGSITGAPKASTMRLIRELEDSPRGVYCGAVGLVGPPWAATRARFGVAIRTVVVDRSTGAASYGTGGGITWSSDAASEHAELLVKAGVLGARGHDFHLFETMAYEPGVGIRSLERHLRRLARSARYFGFPFDAARARASLPAALGPGGAVLVRLRLGRTGELAVETAPLPVDPGRPVVLAIDPEPIDPSTPWPYHKTSRRVPYTVRRERHPDVDDVILVNDRGEVTETTIANLAARLDGRWWTPPVSVGCLPGIERERLVEHGVLAERPLRPVDLRRAESVAVISSLRGWRAAVLV